MPEQIYNINWCDFLILGLILRMGYIGLKTGTGIELFKLIGICVTTLLSLHFYTILSDLLSERLPPLPLTAADAFVFVALCAIVTILFKAARESFFLLIKLEAQNTIDKCGGLLCGLLRGIWISSLVTFFLIISTIDYLEESAKTSLWGSRVIPIAPQIYKGSYNLIFSKISGSAPTNKHVFDALSR